MGKIRRFGGIWQVDPMAELLRKHFQDEPVPPSCHAPVDLIHLAHYTMGDRDLEREVLCLFSTQSQIYCNQMRDAKDIEVWKMAAHTLKGSARSVGAWKVANAAEHSEDLGDARFSANRNNLLRRIEVALREANEFIATLL